MSTVQAAIPDDWLRLIDSDGVNLTLTTLLRLEAWAKLLDLHPRQLAGGLLAGNYLSRQKGRGMEFDELRQYQPGDDIRLIDWRVTARTGKPHTRVYREEKQRPVYLFTDLTSTMYLGSQLMLKSHCAAQMATLLAWRGAAQGNRVGGIIVNSQQHKICRPQSRQAGVLHYLHELVALHQPDWQGLASQRFDDSIRQLKQLVRPGSSLYLISDFALLGEHSLKLLQPLGQHCEITAIIITDPLESTPPTLKATYPLPITDGQQQGYLDSASLKQWQQQVMQRHQWLRQQFRQRHIRTLTLSAGQSLAHQLRRQCQ